MALSAQRRSAYSRTSLTAVLLAGTAMVTAPAFAQDTTEESEQEEPVVAQDIDDPAGNEIIVEGFRATIQNSIEEKRNSTEVFDALSSDEIGDIPALSIGEALETLTGAASTREQGGATEISIRGLGPFLGSTVINGRVATNGSGDRSVNFSQFPSELFSKIGIFKTQSASFIEGGVAGQIVLETIRPIDFGKRRIQGEIKANINPDNLDIDSDQRLQDIGFRGTASYVDQFAVGDGELGISIGYQRNEATNPEQEANVSNTIRACVVDPSNTSDGVFDDGNCDTAGATVAGLRDGSVDLPFVIARNSYSFRSNITDDTRDAIFAGVQYQPSPDVDINLDFQYSTRLFTEQRSDLNFAEGRRIDGPGDANAIEGFDLIFTESGALRQFTGEQRIEAVSEFLERDETYYGGGLSVAAQVADRVTVSLDASYSQTSRTETGTQIRFRTNNQTDIFGNEDAFPGAFESDGSFTDDRVETVTQIMQNGSEALNFIVQDFDVTNPDLFADSARLRNDLEQDRFNRIWAVRADVEYELDNNFFSNFLAGVRYQEQDYRDVPGAIAGTSRFENTFSNEALSVANQECRTEFPESGFLRSISGGNPLVTNVDADGNVIGTANTFATFNALCIAQVLEREDPTGLLEFDDDGIPIAPSGEFNSIQNTDLTERTFALYAQADFDSEVANTPIRGNIGLRVVDTQVLSRGFRSDLNFEVVLDAAGEANGFILAEDPSSLVSSVTTNSYTEFLPSANLVAELTPNFLGRFAVYRALSRPDPSALGDGRVFNLNDNDSEAFATPAEALAGGVANISATGNPLTDPLLSWNVDAGLEWYPNDDTILAFNAYYKSFDGGFETVGQFEAFNIDGQSADLVVNTVQVSDDSSTIYGLEITATHRFSYLPAPLDGLGFKLSYNYADSNFEFEDDVLGAITTVDQETGLTSVSEGLIPPSNLFGFSDNVLSAQAYYSIGDLDLQGVYKFRSNYFQQFVSTPGRIRFIDDVGVFEARISYSLNRNIRFTLEGINIFNEPRTDFRGAPDDFGAISVFGPRYFAGVRARF